MDYVALAAQLMAQRDAKQEALHELELKVLKVLRPQLDEVMNQEQQIKGLSIALAQTQWEARTVSAAHVETHLPCLAIVVTSARAMPNLAVHLEGVADPGEARGAAAGAFSADVLFAG